MVYYINALFVWNKIRIMDIVLFFIIIYNKSNSLQKKKNIINQMFGYVKFSVFYFRSLNARFLFTRDISFIVINVIKIGLIINQVRLLNHWFIDLTIKSLVEPND